MGLGSFRFFLAFLVVISHLWGKMIGGPAAYAVWGFYLISGYLMAYVLNSHYGFTASGLTSFYKNRLIRIYPGYFLAVVLGIVIYKACLLTGVDLNALNPEFGRPNSISSVFFNATLIPVFQTTKLFVPVSQALGLEIGFYLLAPLIVINRHCAILAVVITAGINYKYQIDASSFAVRYSSYWTALFAFSAGTLVYFYKSNLTKYANLKIAVCLWIFQIYLIEKISMFPWEYGLYVSLIFTAYVLISCCDLKVSKIDILLGDMSYLVYLFHTTIGYLLLTLGGGLVVKGLIFFLVAFALTSAISFLLVRFYERPVQSFLKKVL